MENDERKKTKRELFGNAIRVFVILRTSRNMLIRFVTEVLKPAINAPHAVGATGRSPRRQNNDSMRRWSQNMRRPVNNRSRSTG